MQKIVTLEGLKSFKAKLDGLFVRRELKTGSGTEYKTLSDNNLTDAMVEESRTRASPRSRARTPTSPASRPSAAKRSSRATTRRPPSGWKRPRGRRPRPTRRSRARYPRSIRAATRTSQVESAVAAKGYDTVSSVNSKVQAAKTELKAAVDSAVSSVYRPKGSVAFSALPALTAAKAGDVYNVEGAFTTTADFVEGARKSTPRAPTWRAS